MSRARIALLLLLAAAPAHAASGPEWLTPLLATASPAASDSAHAHVLLDERHVVLPGSGRMRTTARGAVRVLDKRGGSGLVVSVPYDRASAEVTNLRTWLLLPDGSWRTSGPKDAIDVALADGGQLASEMRSRGYASAAAPPGAVFAWEWTVEEEVLDCEWWQMFGSDDPVACQRFVLELPAGLEPEVRRWGAHVPEPRRDGQRWTWEARDVRAVRDEVLSPHAFAMLDHIMVVARRVGEGPPPRGVSFTDWASVARWHAGLATASARPTPELNQLASTLTSGRESVFDRARAIAERVQGVNYVSIALGLAHGGGYVPRPAATVLATNTGDCKDKANLFCTLARAAGLEAWMVAVRADGRDAVHPEWPSPHYFNHAIAALRVPAGSGLPAVSDSTPLGPLLYFDPTDPHTPFGALPQHEQGTFALIEDETRGALVQLPLAAPEQVRTAWNIEATLDSTGALRGVWRQRMAGARAASFRALRAQGEPEVRKDFEQVLADWFGTARLERVTMHEEPRRDLVECEVAFTAERFARRLNDTLMGFRSAPFSSRDRFAFNDSTRRYPVALPAQAFAETVTIRLPAGWRPESLPARLGQRLDFAEFEAVWTLTADRLEFRYTTTVQPVTLPVTRYRELREWWAVRNRPFQKQVVLEHGAPR